MYFRPGLGEFEPRCFSVYRVLGGSPEPRHPHLSGQITRPGRVAVSTTQSISSLIFHLFIQSFVLSLFHPPHSSVHSPIPSFCHSLFIYHPFILSHTHSHSRSFFASSFISFFVFSSIHFFIRLRILFFMYPFILLFLL